MNISRRAALSGTAAGAVCALGAVLFAPAAARAGEGEVFTRRGLAIGGFDPVAYHQENRPVRGRAAHEITWKGAKWRFASAENQALFEADPERYAPAYGGYCAYAVSQGYTAKTEPHAFSIEGGRLYLNYSSGVKRTWDVDRPGYIAKSEANWPNVKAGL
ncbi:MAG: YHS domain-containing (seleno)protein [Rhodospirillales bacterium]